jgi:hypothetical protein
MKKIKLIIFSLIIFLISNSVYSQVSGFQGKKNVIAASLFLKSSFYMPNKNGKSGYLSFNDHYSITYERVISRNKSIQFHATSFETNYDPELELGTYNYFTPKSNMPFQKMSCKAFGADILLYTSSHLAPLGAYASLGFDVFISTIDFDTAYYNKYETQTYLLPKFISPKMTTTTGGISFKSGVKQIFFNCISVDFNFQLGMILSKGWEKANFNNEMEEYLKDKIKERLWGHYLWGVNCSVGFVF